MKSFKVSKTYLVQAEDKDKAAATDTTGLEPVEVYVNREYAPRKPKSEKVAAEPVPAEPAK